MYTLVHGVYKLRARGITQRSACAFRGVNALAPGHPLETEVERMKIRLLVAALAGLACADAFAVEDTAPREPIATIERPARIRLFGQNGVGLTMYTNARCEDEYDEEIEASGALSHNFKALVGKKRPNESIGIPETDSTRNLASRDKLWASPYYAEYPLVPGQPVSLQANIASGSGWSCNRGRGIHIAFVPEPGVDYEGDMIRDFGGGSCGIAIRRVAEDGSVSAVLGTPVPARCAVETAKVPELMVMLLEADRLQYRLAEEGAGVDELDNDDDSIEDLQEMLAEAPIAQGMPVCIVAADETRASEFGKALPALLQSRGVQGQVIHGDAKALASDWQLTAERPLTFALAEYYCRSVAGNR